jgi:calcineurin-like phosphoesterase family protein
MGDIFVTSDLHFGHRNILKYQSKERPFDDVQEMNEVLIDKWNQVVKPNDEIWNLGDFAFMSKSKILQILPRLNGKKYHIFGNHDKAMKNPEIQEHFEWMGDYKRVKWFGKVVVLFHYPIHSWEMMGHGSYHFYGHTHYQIPHLYHGRAMDVGVDGNNLFPYNVQDIFEFFDSCNNDEMVDPRGRNR